MTNVINNPGPASSGDSSSGWAVAVIILILVIAAGGFFWFRQNKTAEPSNDAKIDIIIPAPNNTQGQ